MDCGARCGDLNSVCVADRFPPGSSPPGFFCHTLETELVDPPPQHPRRAHMISRLHRDPYSRPGSSTIRFIAPSKWSQRPLEPVLLFGEMINGFQLATGILPCLRHRFYQGGTLFILFSPARSGPAKLPAFASVKEPFGGANGDDHSPFGHGTCICMHPQWLFLSGPAKGPADRSCVPRERENLTRLIGEDLG